MSSFPETQPAFGRGSLLASQFNVLILALPQSRGKKKHSQSEKSLAFNTVVRFIMETLILWTIPFYKFVIISLEDVKITEKLFFLGT